METSSATPIAILMLVVALAPVASADPLLPSACSESLVGCLDAIAPRSTPSNLLPERLQPEPEPVATSGRAPAPPAPDAPLAPQAPVAPAPAPVAPLPASLAPAASPAPAATAPPESEGQAATPPRPLVEPSLVGVFIGAATLLILALGILVVLVSEIRSRPRAHGTTLADAARAEAMQRDIDRAWKNARSTKG